VSRARYLITLSVKRDKFRKDVHSIVAVQRSRCYQRPRYSNVPILRKDTMYIFRIVSYHNAIPKLQNASRRSRIAILSTMRQFLPFIRSLLPTPLPSKGRLLNVRIRVLIEMTGFRSRSMRGVSIVQSDSWTHRVTSFIGFISLGWSIFMNRPMIGHVCLGGAC